MIYAKEKVQRTEWMREARFGMFIHWGLYAIPARGEWVRSRENMTPETYMRYFDSFDPVDYDPREWAKLARAAGMKYAVLTAKHHDGFCLFDSKLTDFKSTNACGRDLVREYVEAFRAEGLKVGLYYSLLDWNHPAYQAWGDMIHPMRDNPAYKAQDGSNAGEYVDYLHGQVRELLTNYGKIDLVWFDFSYGEKSGEYWRAKELVKMCRELQPGICIDDRLGDGSGDFMGPEQAIPKANPRDAEGNLLFWEECMTLNNHWGYCSGDHDYKSAADVVHKLTECVSKGGNLLLNVGPDARGRIPEESAEILREVGDWMRLNGESVYGCGEAEAEKPEFWGRFTQGHGCVYLHVYEPVVGAIAIPNLKSKTKNVRLLADGAELPTDDPWNVNAYPEPDCLFIQMRRYNLEDPKDTVIRIALK